MIFFNKKLLVPISAVISVGIIGFAVYTVLGKNTTNTKTPTKISNSLEVSDTAFQLSSSTIKAWEEAQKRSQGTSTIVSTLAQPTEELTETEIFARDLFTKFMSIKAKGGTFDSVESQSLVNSLLSQTENRKKPYIASDLSIVYKNSEADIKMYINNVASVILNQKIPEGNEILIFGNALENQDKKEITRLDEFITAYSNMNKQFLNINVPSSIMSLHLDLVINSTFLKQDLSNMRQYFNDSLLGFLGFSNYQKDFEAFELSLKNIRTFITEKNITFTPKEAGYAFVSGI